PETRPPRPRAPVSFRGAAFRSGLPETASHMVSFWPNLGRSIPMSSARRQPYNGLQPAEFRGTERERAAIVFDQVGDYGQSQAASRLRFVKPPAASQRLPRLFLRYPRPVVLDRQFEERVRGAGRQTQRDRLLRPFSGILHEIADDLLQILPLA